MKFTDVLEYIALMVVGLGFWVLLIWWLVRFFRKGYKPAAPAVPANAASYICTVCNEKGHAVFKVKGSGMIEAVLWLLVLSWPFALVYSIWRRTGRLVVCGACGGQVIPVDSPAAKRLAKAAD
jgi:hypothetical protein